MKLARQDIMRSFVAGAHEPPPIASLYWAGDVAYSFSTPICIRYWASPDDPEPLGFLLYNPASVSYRAKRSRVMVAHAHDLRQEIRSAGYVKNIYLQVNPDEHPWIYTPQIYVGRHRDPAWQQGYTWGYMKKLTEKRAPSPEMRALVDRHFRGFFEYES